MDSVGTLSYLGPSGVPPTSVRNLPVFAVAVPAVCEEDYSHNLLLLGIPLPSRGSQFPCVYTLTMGGDCGTFAVGGAC